MGKAAALIVALLMVVAAAVASPAGADMSTPPTGGPGLWSVTSAGAVQAIGGAVWYGDASGLELWQPVIGIASTPTGRGYWLAARDSGVFSYGDAPYRGNLIDQLIARDNLPPGTLNGGNILQYLHGEIVDIAPAPDGGGYWLLGADGGVFNFGAAAFQGSLSGSLDGNYLPLATDITPVVGGYRITVFLYLPTATADPAGLVDGIEQFWNCTSGACHFQGQRAAFMAVPGVPTTPPPPPSAPSPPPAPPGGACDPNYSPCIPPPPPDLDCVHIGRQVTVIGPSDPHRLDGDNDGIGCEAFA